MKGEIFNILEDFVVENWGEEVFEEIYDNIHNNLITKEPFVGPGTYPDSDFMSMVNATVEKLGVPLDQAMHAFGKYCFPRLGAKMPGYVEGFDHPKDFLKTVGDVIHVEVKKVFKDANPPDFKYRDPAPDKLVMIYQSKRKFYDFLEGLLAGTADHFNTEISVKREIVATEPDEICEFELTFA